MVTYTITLNGVNPEGTEVIDSSITTFIAAETTAAGLLKGTSVSHTHQSAVDDVLNVVAGTYKVYFTSFGSSIKYVGEIVVSAAANLTDLLVTV